MHIKIVSWRDFIYLPTVSIFPLPWVPKVYSLFPCEWQKSSPKVVFLWTLYLRNRKPSITNLWHPGLYSADGLVVLYSLDLSSKYYFKVTEGCPFSLADAQDWQGFLKVTISNKFFLQFSLSYRVLCFFPWAFLEFMKIFNHSFLLRPLYLCDSSQYNVNHVNNLHMLIIGK